MEKNLYSLILMTEVVREIDALAGSKGVSRSALVNEILAEHVNLSTPKQWIGQVFTHAASKVEEGGQIYAQHRSGGALRLKTALNYNYNPAMGYILELSAENGAYQGTFRAATRTKSEVLLSRLNIFYEMWIQIESMMLAGQMGDVSRCVIEKGGMRRGLAVSQGGQVHAARELGREIGVYILLFDSTLKRYLESDNGMDMETYQTMTELYRQYLDQAGIVL